MTFISKKFLIHISKILRNLVFIFAIFIFTSFQINSVKFFTTGDGLPDNRIIDISQDKFGQLWVLTGSSISVYNGSNWKNFSTKFQHQGNPFNNHLKNFNKILIDQKDTKFFLSNDGEIFRLENKNIEPLSSPLNSRGIPFTDFDLVNDGNRQIIWTSTKLNGLAYHDNSWFTFTKQEGLISNEILHIKSSGDVLLVITSQGLQFIRDKRVVFTFRDFDFKKFTSISLAFDKNSRFYENIPAFWLLADNRLYKFENEKVSDQTFKFFNPYREFYSKIYTNGGGKIYLTNKDFIKVINVTSGDFQVLNKETEIVGTPQVLFVDREKNLWIGTDKRLIKINFTSVLRLSNEDGLNDSKITSLLKTGNDLYLGHPDNKLTIYSGNRFYKLNFENQIKFYRKNISSASTEIRKIQTSGNKILFLSGNSGIFELNQRFVIKPVYLINNSSDYISDFISLPDGGLLLCGKFTDRNIVKNLILINSKQSLPADDLLNSIQPERLFLSREGSIWISGQGLVVVKIFKGKTEKINIGQFLTSEKINVICEDRGSNIFIGTNTGFVVLMKNGEIKTYNLGEHINSNGDLGVYSFYFDELNNLWLMTSKGLKFWNWKEFKSSYEWKNIIPVRENFQSIDEVNGKIFVASENGLFIISSSEDEIKDIQPQVYIQEIVVNGNFYDGLTDIVLSEKPSLKIRFNAVLLSTNNVEFSYKLEGYDKDWSEPAYLREVYYSNLPEGNYRFLLRARSSFTDWTHPVSTALIKVKIPLYKKFEIIIPLLSLLVTLIILVYFLVHRKKSVNQDLISLKKQIEGLEKQNKQLRQEFNKALELSKSRMTFLASLSHELRTPINSLIGFVDILLDSKINLNEEERYKYLNYISINSRKLLILINDIIDLAKIDSGTISLDYSEVNLNAEVRETINLFREKIKSKHLDLILELDPELETQPLYIDRNRVHQIISNLITNAIKFTEEGYIKISTRKDMDKFILSVEDTGIGIPEGEINFIFEEFRRSSNAIKKSIEGTGLGLSITKRLVELMGGEIKVESQEGIGSTFTVIFKSKKETTKKFENNIDSIRN